MGAKIDRGVAFAQLGLSGLFILKAYHYDIVGNVEGGLLYLMLFLVNLFLAGVNWQSAEEKK